MYKSKTSSTSLSLSLSSEDFQPFQTCFRLHLTAKLMPKPSQVSSLNKALEVLAPTAYRSTFLQVFQCHDLSSARKKPSTKHTGVCALHFPGQWVLLGSMHMMLFLMPCLALPCLAPTMPCLLVINSLPKPTQTRYFESNFG